MSSEIEKALKDVTKEFYITNEERLTLCEMLACVSVVLREGKLHFNGPGEHNLNYAALADDIARRFANMPVEQEQ